MCTHQLPGMNMIHLYCKRRLTKIKYHVPILYHTTFHLVYQNYFVLSEELQCPRLMA